MADALNLSELEGQLETLSCLLLEDPDNQELQALYDEVSEVIKLSAEVHQQSDAPATQQQAVATGLSTQPLEAAEAPLAPSPLLDQVRQVQQRAALDGRGPAEWAIGAQCLALYRADGNWYKATVQGVAENGGFNVTFQGYGGQEVVPRESVRSNPDEDGSYKGVAAPKIRKVDEGAQVEEMPKWLAIKPTDDDKTRQKKRKLAKAFKSKARFARLDLQQKQKADAWKQFVSGKHGKSKRKG